MTSPRVEAIVIGASAGAVDALSAILPPLPPGFGIPILVVVHLPIDKNSMLTELFEQKCQLKVCEAEDKAPIQPGTIYFAPPDYHLLVEHDRRMSLSSEEPVHYARPSIDVLFETAADAYGKALVGVILTGSNSDGAQGLKSISEAGGVALVQDPQLAYSSNMPRAALFGCPQAQPLSLDQIRIYLTQIGENG